jgi:CheY-like chemotaxis protein
MAFKHVLVVEDDPDLRDSLVEILESEGHGVLSAENGERALELLSWGEPPSLIVLDLMMPVMNGWEFLEIIRRDARLKSVPVVVVTAARDAKVEGASYCIEKPLILDKLLGLLKVVESHARAAAQ